MSVRTPPRCNVAFRRWARAQGYSVRPLPEPLQGERDAWCVPLLRRMGFLWDAGPDAVGVHFQAGSRRMAATLRALRALPGWHEQTAAADAFLGRVPLAQWSDAFGAILGPRRRRQPARQAPSSALAGPSSRRDRASGPTVDPAHPASQPHG